MTAFGQYVDDGTVSTIKERDYKDATDLVTVNAREDPIHTSGKSLPLGAKDTGHAIAFLPGQGADAGTLGIATEQAPTLRSGCDNYGLNNGGGKPGQGYPAVLTHQVRRLTPIECERLQGMPDNHTRIPWRGKPAEDCPDGPRYKAIGNSMAVPVMRWIGQRIDQIDTLLRGSTPVAGGCNDTPKGVPSSNVRQPPAKVEKMEQGALFC